MLRRFKDVKVGQKFKDFPGHPYSAGAWTKIKPTRIGTSLTEFNTVNEFQTVYVTTNDDDLCDVVS